MAALVTHDPDRKKSKPCLDHLVGNGEQRDRHVEAQHLRGLAVDDELALGRRPDYMAGARLPEGNFGRCKSRY